MAGQNDTNVEDDPCPNAKKSRNMFQLTEDYKSKIKRLPPVSQATVYVLPATVAALLLMALCVAFKSIRRCRKSQVQENTEQS